MAKPIDVIYTHGVFQPAAPLELEIPEGQRLTLLLLEYSADLNQSIEDTDLQAWCAEQAGTPVPSIAEVRQRLSSIPGSMADVVITERRERL